MKRGNATGSIYKLSGKRRNPWTVKVTTGYDDQGRQQQKYIGYYTSKREAQAALDDFMVNPQSTRMTVKEAWEGWLSSTQVSKGTISAYKASFNKLTPIYNLDLRDINLDIIQRFVDSPPRTYATCTAMRKTLANILEYGFAHDACPASRKALLEYVVLPDRPTKQEIDRKPFTPDEIQDAIDKQCSLAVVLLFTGLRSGEFIGLTRDQIDLERQVIYVRKSKTKAGIRDVPIPDRLIPWVQRLIDAGALGKNKNYLDTHFWKPYMKNHVRHDCRHTYISLLTNAGVDERTIKALVGHAGGVTSDVYTHYNIQDLVQIVNSAFEKYLPVIVDQKPDYTCQLFA